MALIEYQKRAVAILETLTPARLGDRNDQTVTQGRSAWPKYSGCADLAHCMYELLGLKHPKINRAPNWQSGLNVTLLDTWYGAARPAPSAAEEWAQVDGGDVLIRWSSRALAKRLGKPYTWDAHVVCVMANLGDQLATAEFGQEAPLVGRQFLRSVVPPHGERPWQRWLPLAAVLETCNVR